ncbi:hypothetical protein LXL04_005734 [Taraxacum kok-saghyz]
MMFGASTAKPPHMSIDDVKRDVGCRHTYLPHTASVDTAAAFLESAAVREDAPVPAWDPCLGEWEVVSLADDGEDFEDFGEGVLPAFVANLGLWYQTLQKLPMMRQNTEKKGPYDEELLTAAAKYVNTIRKVNSIKKMKIKVRNPMILYEYTQEHSRTLKNICRIYEDHSRIDEEHSRT